MKYNCDFFQSKKSQKLKKSSKEAKFESKKLNIISSTKRPFKEIMNIERPFYSPNLERSQEGHKYKNKLFTGAKKGNTFQERLDRFRIENRLSNQRKQYIKGNAPKNDHNSLKNDFSGKKMKTMENFRGGQYYQLKKENTRECTPSNSKKENLNFDQNRSMSLKKMKRKTKRSKRNSPEVKKITRKIGKYKNYDFKKILKKNKDKKGKTLEEWCEEQEAQEEKQTFSKFLKNENNHNKKIFKVKIQIDILGHSQCSC